jgi:hypothetical protein
VAFSIIDEDKSWVISWSTKCNNIRRIRIRIYIAEDERNQSIDWQNKI